jgi:hypothetical protein
MLMVDSCKSIEGKHPNLEHRMPKVGKTDAYDLGEVKVVTLLAHDFRDDFEDEVVTRANVIRDHD